MGKKFKKVASVIIAISMFASLAVTGYFTFQGTDNKTVNYMLLLTVFLMCIYLLINTSKTKK